MKDADDQDAVGFSDVEDAVAPVAEYADFRPDVRIGRGQFRLVAEPLASLVEPSHAGVRDIGAEPLKTERGDLVILGRRLAA
jgi:hypothetical protein